MQSGKGKIIVFSAPSGTGKSTVIKRLRQYPELKLGFSISATCRKPREGESHGREYYFITDEEFRRRVEAGEFVEWEEVYAGTCYGTLRSEVERVVNEGSNLLMDIDVKGGMNVKSIYGNEAISIFLLPPSIEALGERLRGRGTESVEAIEKRLARAEYELGFADKFDVRVVNDDLDRAVEEVYAIVKKFVEAE